MEGNGKRKCREAEVAASFQKTHQKDRPPRKTSMQDTPLPLLAVHLCVYKHVRVVYSGEERALQHTDQRVHSGRREAVVCCPKHVKRKECLFPQILSLSAG